jgi:HPt (histidine-containing phosphotransfer) domain-containing protein
VLCDQLGRVMREPSARMLGDEAHAVAGSAGLLGFHRLTNAARVLEDRCRAGEPVTSAFTAARGAADAAERVLAAWIARLEQEIKREAAA